MSLYVVVSRYNRNIDWVYKLKNVDKFLIYEKELPNCEYNVPVNKGNEASAYLKYIVDHYHDLPEYTLFLHDEEYSWHHKGSIGERFNEFACISPIPKYYNINNSILGSILTNVWWGEIKNWYDEYIEDYIPYDSLPDKDWTVGHIGCAQFVVHKSIITVLPREFYKRLYDWIITTDITSDKSGRFLEWTWHLFWVIYPKMIKNKE